MELSLSFPVMLSIIVTSAQISEILVLKTDFNKASSYSALYCLNSQCMYTKK